uniref:Uncharacterized protein n=1 Tax=Zea mays TaxID=4577 RepID=B6SPP3_MAIZE|nr:hypothetical protein [Zea mays]ACG43881.1 hypothetical protein [Zea mays]ACG47570.1 hypothetical protein [Zea mays]
MECGSKKAAGGVLALLLLQLVLAPTTATARLLQADTSTVVGLDIIAREFGHPVRGILCGETCVFLPCYTAAMGCQCIGQICMM